MIRALVVAIAVLSSTCRADLSVPAESSIGCNAQSDCPSGSICLQDVHLCISTRSPCVGETSTGIAPVTDGNQCPLANGTPGLCLGGVCAPPRCGDGLVTSGEACDDGDNLNNGEGSCVADCSAVQRCGDGATDGTERCDYGLLNTSDWRLVAACNTTCDGFAPHCGDAIIAQQERCDDGEDNGGGPGFCRTDCQRVQGCGNGLIEGAEACDDGDTETPEVPGNGDGCSATCSVELGWYCQGEPSTCRVQLFVSDDAVGLGDGSAWVDAFTHLNDALDYAAVAPTVPVEIWVEDLNDDDLPFTEMEVCADVNRCDNSSGVLSFVDQCEDVCILDGLTITEGENPGYGASGVGIGAESTPTLRNLVIRDNRTTLVDGDAAGLVAYHAGGLFENITFLHNTGYSYGGALKIWGSATSGTPTIRGCLFLGNRAGYGPAVVLSEAHARIENSVLSGNIASGDVAGAIYANNYGPPADAPALALVVVTNSTFVGNRVLSGSSVVYATGYTQVTVINSIFWDNGSESVLVDNSEPFSMTYSIDQNGAAGMGNLTSCGAPLACFVDADGPDDTPGTLDDDLRLLSGASGIDAGSNTGAPATLTDVAGAPRFVDDPATSNGGEGTPPVVDIGAYEYQP